MAETPSKISPLFKPRGRGARVAMLPARRAEGKAAASLGALASTSVCEDA